MYQSNSRALDFTFPKLHVGKNFYVDFFAFDPASGSMRRKKYMLDGISGISNRRHHGNFLVAELTKKLLSGWNPFVNCEQNRSFTSFDVCCDRYQSTIDRMSREATRRSYTSHLKKIREYNESLPIPIKYIYQYDTLFVSDYLDYSYIDCEYTARTRNNRRGFCFTFAEFLVQKKYIESNPVEKIPVLTEMEKIRKDLSPEQLHRIRDYLSEHDRHYLLACYLLYYCLIRPKEQSFIRIQDISLKNQTIFIPKSVSKNHRDDIVAVNKKVIMLMIDLHIFDSPGNYYLFGRRFRPSQTRYNSKQFNNRWETIRKKLGFSMCYQFYSLKDSGIRDLANLKGVVVARDQARHSDVSTTNKYLQHHGAVVHHCLLDFDGNL